MPRTLIEQVMPFVIDVVSNRRPSYVIIQSTKTASASTFQGLVETFIRAILARVNDFDGKLTEFGFGATIGLRVTPVQATLHGIRVSSSVTGRSPDLRGYAVWQRVSSFSPRPSNTLVIDLDGSVVTRQV